MAFKMKAGKEGPMKKNFPSVFKNTTVEVGDNTITATKKGLTVTGPGGKISKYKPNTAGYDAAKQQYIDAGGESPMNLGSSNEVSPKDYTKKYRATGSGPMLKKSSMKMEKASEKFIESPKKLKPITKGKQSRVKNIKPEAKPNKRNYNF